MIKILFTDIDGVLTDGKILTGLDGNYIKTLCFKDFDAVSELRKTDITFGIVTGEDDAFTELVKSRMKPDYFIAGCKKKREAIQDIIKKEGIALEEVCYIGDGKYDIEAIMMAGFGVCPADAIEEVKSVADCVLSSLGGGGCLSETLTKLKIRVGAQRESIESVNDFNQVLLAHQKLTQKVIENFSCRQAMEQCIQLLIRQFKSGAQLLLCGNGGSAADAQHIATEFVSRFYAERRAMNAEALTVNTSSLTAIGNDYSYNEIFARQIEAKGKNGDVLIGITTSGNSENVLCALKKAKEQDLFTIIMTGMNTKEVDEFADIVISVPSSDTPRIQEMHILIGHIICEYVERAFVS